MGGGNGQKSATSRARNQAKAEAEKARIKLISCKNGGTLPMFLILRYLLIILICYVHFHGEFPLDFMAISIIFNNWNMRVKPETVWYSGYLLGPKSCDEAAYLDRADPKTTCVRVFNMLDDVFSANTCE